MLVNMQQISKHTMQTYTPADTEKPTTVPPAIQDWFRCLSDAGHTSHLVGECVLQIALGRRPNHYRAHSPISHNTLLSLALRSIPTGRDSATVTIPTAAGPLDVLTNRRLSQTVLDLQSTPFAVLALALDPLTGELIAQDRAPGDIASRTLSPADDVSARAHDGFALEAARLIAVYGLRPSKALFEAARKIPVEVAPARPTGLRRQLRELLLAPDVRAGLEFLRDCGAEATLVPGARADAAAIVANLPAELRVRFCAWFQGADPKDLLRGLRFGGEFSSTLYRMLDHHPIDEWVQPNQDPSLRRLLKHLPPSEIADLLALRGAEARVLRELGRPAEAAQLLGRLEALEQRIDRMREAQRKRRERTRLVISSAQIMQTLDCTPGPEVGRAIEYLEDIVAADPGANNLEALLSALEQRRTDR